MRPGTGAILIASGALIAAHGMSTSAAVGASSLGDPAAAHVEAAQEHYRRGEYAAALEQYRQALVEAPERPELRYNEGSTLYKLGEYGPSLEIFEETTEAGEDQVVSRSLYNAGNTLFQLQDFAKAADAYTRALEGDPDDLDARANLELALRRIQEQREQQSQQGGEQGQEEGDPEEGGDRLPGEDQSEPEDGDQQDPQDQEGQQEEQGQQDEQDQQEQGEPDEQQGPESDEEPAQEEEAGMTREEAEQLMEALTDGDREAQRRRFRILLPGSQEKDW